MRTSATVLALLVVLVASAGLVLAAGAESPQSLENIEPEDEPILVYEIALDANGDARWNITARFPMGQPEEADAFEAVSRSYTREDPEEYLPVEPFETGATEIGESLDRSMRIEDVDRDVVRSNQTGMLTLTFTWTAFGDAGDNRVRVGDTFSATQQTWLSTLEANQYIRIHAPEGYTVESSGMRVQNRTLWADGPADLSDTDLAGTFIASSPSGIAGRFAVLPALGGAGMILALLALALLVSYRREWPPAVDTVEQATALFAGPDPAEPEATSPAEAAESPGDDPMSDPALLSDEELVTALIDQHGGRMKQATIVEETDWSNAKVSQLLSQMANDGEIEKLRIGRENLISIQDEPDQ